MKKNLYLLMLTILIVTMSELQTAGMMPYISSDLSVDMGQTGMLVSIYALGMALGGPLIAYFFRHVKPKNSLSIIILLYALIEILAPIVHDFWWLFIARLMTGCLAGATFGSTLTIAAKISQSVETIGKNISIVLSGLMIGTVIGLPLSHYIANEWSWQSSFYLLGIMTIILFVINLLILPSLPAATKSESSQDINNLRSKKLWGSYVVSFLTIGAAYGSFSFFTPLLQENAGLSASATTATLFGYGICTIIGNSIVGIYADKYPVYVLRIGHSLLLISLIIISLFSYNSTITVPMVLIVGLVGISMNPALVKRVNEAGGTGNLVTTVHTAVITLGVTSGTLFSSFAMKFFGDNPVIATWTGVFLVVIVSLVLFLQTNNSKKV